MKEHNFRLKELRLVKWLSINKLSKSLKISATTLNRWEQDITRPHANFLIKLAVFFMLGLIIYWISNIRYPIKPYTITIQQIINTLNNKTWHIY